MVKSMFFNSVNPGTNPELYLQFIRHLATEAFTLKGKVVINTCGWVEGLGAEILMHFAKAMDRPSSQFILLESNNKYCEADLAALGLWMTKIAGDVRAPTTGNRIAK